jgi:hypothetical protein
MRLDDLAARLVIVEAKLATLTGTTINVANATNIEDLDTRLSIVEVHVDQLLVDKTQSHIESIISTPANEAPVSVDTVVALSASADVPEAASIVTDVVQAQIEAPAVDHPAVAEIVAAAVAAVVTADPSIVTDPEAIINTITAAVAELPTPPADVAIEAADAVADVVSIAIGEDVDNEIHQQIVEAITSPSDPALDAIEARLVAAEAKVDSLLGK